MPEIIAAENQIIAHLESAYAGEPVRAVDVMRQVSFRYPATVVHAAYWSLIRDNRISRSADGLVNLVSN